MTVEKANPITGHLLTLMPPTAQQKDPFGWIELLNGSKAAGYVYLETDLTPGNPHLSGDGSYIVTAMPMSSLSVLLDILRNEKNLQIRYFDPQSPNVGPSVFIEPAFGGAQSFQVGSHMPPEIKQELERLRDRSSRTDRP